MSEESLKSALEYASGLAVSASVPRLSEPVHGAAQFMVVPDGMQVVAVPPECRAPRRKVQLATPDITAFVALVKLYSLDTDSLRVFTKRSAHNLDAVLDSNPSSAAGLVKVGDVNYGLCENSITFEPRWTPEWRAWIAVHDKALSQVSLAELIEDFGSVLVSPSAADASELARTFQATRSSSFRSGTRLDNGDTSLEFVQTTAGTSKNGALEIPKAFVFRIEPWAGFGGAVEITAALRYRLSDDGKLSFILHFVSLDRAMDALFDHLLKQAGEGLAGITTVFEV